MLDGVSWLPVCIHQCRHTYCKAANWSPPPSASLLGPKAPAFGSLACQLGLTDHVVTCLGFCFPPTPLSWLREKKNVFDFFSFDQ